MTHPAPLEDPRTPARLAANCRAADLTSFERLEALRNIALRRAVLARELAQLEALEGAHRAALAGGRA
ncbi:hypothetical protein [Deinococcus arcticus]|uniref:Uncharacterized protein n=1 Tax=Deinococcus arcticus TaxID=2136176 RepID=A0A2T3WB04_9DEIO|nr:hypothetical protein [Deinococcus arcticus]PTA68984.1 hypothetical protein C8263_04075 [Deinococcus arcticus]